MPSSSVYAFPGQGTQQVGMGHAMADSYPETAGRVFSIADDLMPFSVSQVCFEGPEDVLTQTEITQPALFTTSTAILMAMKSQGLHPVAVAGHSIGEYAALVAAGSVSFEEMLPVVQLRGELMARASRQIPGAMAAVIGLSLSEVEDVCEAASPHGVVEPSNINAPTQVVISGEVKAIEQAMQVTKHRGARAVRLKVSAPFHCSLMADVRNELAPAIEDLHIDDPRIPVVANATGNYVQTSSDIRAALLNQVAQPVRWTESVERLIGDGHTTFVQVGPGNVLTGLIRSINRSVRTVSIAVPDDIQQFIAQ